MGDISEDSGLENLMRQSLHKNNINGAKIFRINLVGNLENIQRFIATKQIFGQERGDRNIEELCGISTYSCSMLLSGLVAVLMTAHSPV